MADSADRRRQGQGPRAGSCGRKPEMFAGFGRCHPVTLAAWLTALLVLGIAETMAEPKPLTLLLHLPALLLPALLFAYTAPPRLRRFVLLLSAPLAAVEIAMLGA